MKKSKAQKIIAKATKDAISGLKSKDIRKGLGDSTIEITKENYSFVKYLRGMALNTWADAKTEQKIFKALNETYGTEGGFLVPREVSSELIELLREKSVVRTMPGVRILKMKSDQLEIGRMDNGAVTTWGGENTTIAEDTNTSFGQVTLQLKKAVTLYKTSRELLMDANVGVEQLVKNDMADSIALAEDLAFLEGTGGRQPLGFYNHPSILNTDLNGAFSYDSIRDALYNVELNLGEITGWIAHPRVKNTLRKFKDANGNYLYQEAEADGKMPLLAGIPIMYTTQLGITLRPGSAETWLLGGQFSNMLIGEKEDIRIETTNEGGGAFALDQVHIKAVRRVDMALRHPTTFVRVVGIQA